MRDGTSPPLRGTSPFRGGFWGRGRHADFGAGNFLLHMPGLSDKAFRRLYTVSRRNAMERNRRNARLCPPGKAPIQAMAGGVHGVRGPALVTWKFWLAPGRFCPLCPSAKWVVRPQTDEILSSNRFQRGRVPPGLKYSKAEDDFSVYQAISASGGGVYLPPLASRRAIPLLLRKEAS